jgi:Stress responsive A/B Barrel Domain
MEGCMIHNVYFWLKDDLSSEQRSLFESELLRLPQIPYISSGAVGTPAKTEERSVTDHSFDYSLTLEFKNMADHEFYQGKCQDHQRFIRTCKPFFAEVIVYDSEPLN